MELLTELYKKWRGETPVRTERLAGAGSNRTYYRMADGEGHTVIGCVGTSSEENRAFIYLSRHFADKQLPVPEVLAYSSDYLRYLQTDLGSTSLFDAIRKGREAGGQYDERERELLRQTIRMLPKIQFMGGEGLDYSHCYPQPSFDREGIFFDLNYFKYCFLKATGIDFHEVRLEADFRALAEDLLAEPSETFMYRDFQARNVMSLPQPLRRRGDNSPSFGGVGETLYFIDFQGGRRGPFYYDIASFLWQASARYPDSLRRELTDEYYAAAQQFATMPSREHFDCRLRLFVLFRTLQVLGAYGFRGYFERKQHFIDSIPPAIQNLRELLTGIANPLQPEDSKSGFVAHRYPYLAEVLTNLTSLLLPPSTLNPQHSPLIVRVFSFSYRRGIPEDESGNGGGYVFDCRSTHNPGRYEQYKKMTGLDEPVIRFLENDGEILTFLDSVYRLADAHVERYLERGFTSLMFSFGCTGGQHRSVYSAQHLAEHLHSKYGVEVRLCHREQGISQTLPAVTAS